KKMISMGVQATHAILAILFIATVKADEVCENCFELSADIFLMVIVMDMLLTTFVMMITYRCTKNKSSAGRTQTSKASAPLAGRGPAVPSRDYEVSIAYTNTFIIKTSFHFCTNFAFLFFVFVWSQLFLIILKCYLRTQFDSSKKNLKRHFSYHQII
uniref:Uncharacterized protein n=1 Tax=Mola mola TaxID=94237 RepID=A0A3Q3W4S7_MOLML